MPLVMLKKNWQGTFRRCVRDADGQILETILFTPGEPIEVPLEHWKLVENDIGPALLLGELVNGKFCVRDPKDFHFVLPDPIPQSGTEGSPIKAETPADTPTGDNPEPKAETENEPADESTPRGKGNKSAKALIGKE